MGMDTDKETVRKALEQGAIDEEIDESRLGEANLTVVALYPVPTVEFVKKNADRFKKGSIVIDVGGVKGYVVNGCTPILDEKGVYFLGTHPMAGTENSGFDYSKADMFVKASYILTPTESTPQIAIDLVSTLGSCMGFGQVVIATPEQHDINIAFTSQLAHVVSNAYVKSPTAQVHHGFSAGSYRDLTRVAHLNPQMWSELMIDDADALAFEIDHLIESLGAYSRALKDRDQRYLENLLAEGDRIKRALDDEASH